MKISKQWISFRQCLVKHTPKILIVLLVIALLGVSVKWAQSILENQKLQEEAKSAHLEIERLKGDIAQARQDMEIAMQQEKDHCKALMTENEERTAAFAKQAEKCIPMMKRFGIQHSS
jgi:hypothetical protein